MSPLAEAIYEILRNRTSLPDPRITYSELAERLRDVSEDFEYMHHRSRPLYTALWEVGAECRRLDLPLLPALVVRADTRRPGETYYGGKDPGIVFKGERVAEWRRELEAVGRSTYPSRGRRSGPQRHKRRR